MGFGYRAIGTSARALDAWWPCKFIEPAVDRPDAGHLCRARGARASMPSSTTSHRRTLARIALRKLHARRFGIQSLQHLHDQAALHPAGLLGIDEVPDRRVQPRIRVDT